MAPIKLSKEEIVHLTKAYKEVYKFINALKLSNEYNSLPVFVKKPGIRSELSESTIYHFIKEGLIMQELKNPEISRGIADILAYDSDSNEKKIEIKGTGIWEFSQLSQKDLDADYLVWVNYGNYINDDNKDSIEVYILKDPKESVLKPDKTSLRKFVNLVGDSLELIEINPIQFKVINRQYSLDKFKNLRNETSKRKNFLNRIEIIGILAINDLEKEFEFIREAKDNNEAREKFREFIKRSKKLQDYIKKKNLENRI